MKKTVLKGFRR